MKGDEAHLDGALWIFGYGSLVWRPAFAYEHREPAVVSGWTRRFWQGSIDHRGVPGAPGRVATLVPEPDAECWGLAYRVAPTQAPAVLAQLDVREQKGYERHRVRARLPSGQQVIDALVYVAGQSNPHYLGPASLDRIAEQVRWARGPSGPNIEYVTRLASALREMDADDPHVYELEGRL